MQYDMSNNMVRFLCKLNEMCKNDSPVPVHLVGLSLDIPDDEIKDIVVKLKENGFLDILSSDGDSICITPAGIDYANS